MKKHDLSFWVSQQFCKSHILSRFVSKKIGLIVQQWLQSKLLNYVLTQNPLEVNEITSFVEECQSNKEHLSKVEDRK